MAGRADGLPFAIRPVPQDEVNRLDRLARRTSRLQLNNTLDTDSPDANPGGGAKRQRPGMTRGPGHGKMTKGAAPAGAPKAFGKESSGPRAQTVATAFTREAKRDIFRATVFLCSTPLVTPRASSGWAAFKAA